MINQFSKIFKTLNIIYLRATASEIFEFHGYLNIFRKLVDLSCPKVN